MTQISRPFQITLAALVLIVAVWFVALRGHSSGGESSSAPQPAAKAPAPQSAPGGGTPASKGGVYHGSAPGVEGLSRAIQKARGAVAQSQQNAQQLQQKSAQASGESQAQPKGQSQRAQSQTQTQNGQAQNGQSQAQAKAASGVPAMQATVEAELKQGKVVAVLFWNPKGAVDATVRRELHKARGSLHGKLAVHVARSSEVGSFGNFTHTVQVYSTPTILLINKQGQTSSLSGLTDAFSIAQAIKEVKRAK